MADHQQPRRTRDGVVAFVNERAFSLIEIIIVVIVLMIGATLAASSRGIRSPQRDVNAAQSHLLRSVLAWSERARMTSTDYLVYFDSQRESVSIYEGDAVQDTMLVEQLVLSDDPYKVDLVTQSTSRADTTLTINTHGVIVGQVKVQLQSNDASSIFQVPEF